MIDVTKVAWRKATACNGSAACVEVAPLADGWVAIRDTKSPDSPVLLFSGDEWAAFIAGAKRGEFDPATLAA